MSGLLQLCATPIGNLQDITPRVIEALQNADVIAAEDTRNSIKLLNHFDIHTPMTSYHEFNKVEKAYDLIRQLKDGRTVALITDAGTPGISDPGEVLVTMCHEQGIPVTSLPGACACITALTMSGLPTRRFAFEAFLPSDERERKERRQILEDLKTETRTMIVYEAPHHLKATLKDLHEALGDRELAICKELTKRFESVHRTTLLGAISFFEENEPKGEYVLVIRGRSFKDIRQEEAASYQSLPLSEHMKQYEDQGIERKEAMKLVAKDRGISKRDVYRMLLEDGEE